MSPVRILLAILALCILASACKRMLNKSVRNANKVQPRVAAEMISEPELVLKVKEAKDTIDKLAMSKTNIPEVENKAYKMLEDAFDPVFDNYKDIDQIRDGIEYFMNRK